MALQVLLNMKLQSASNTPAAGADRSGSASPTHRPHSSVPTRSGRAVVSARKALVVGPAAPPPRGPPLTAPPPPIARIPTATPDRSTGTRDAVRVNVGADLHNQVARATSPPGTVTSDGRASSPGNAGVSAEWGLQSFGRDRDPGSPLPWGDPGAPTPMQLWKMCYSPGSVVNGPGSRAPQPPSPRSRTEAADAGFGRHASPRRAASPPRSRDNTDGPGFLPPVAPRIPHSPRSADMGL